VALKLPTSHQKRRSVRALVDGQLGSDSVLHAESVMDTLDERNLACA
jgi:hypothetical protein